MAKELRIIGLSGSLREGSYNTATLAALQELASPSTRLEIRRLHKIPLFNEDVEALGWPAPVAALREDVAASDGVIFASPEYNYSMTGVLKNAIDWLSRPAGAGALRGKPAAIVGATPGRFGTTRSQTHLREVIYYNDMPLLPTGEVLIAHAGDRFSDGVLIDGDTRDFLARMIGDFENWVARHRA